MTIIPKESRHTPADKWWCARRVLTSAAVQTCHVGTCEGLTVGATKAIKADTHVLVGGGGVPNTCASILARIGAANVWNKSGRVERLSLASIFKIKCDAFSGHKSIFLEILWAQTTIPDISSWNTLAISVLLSHPVCS